MRKFVKHRTLTDPIHDSLHLDSWCFDDIVDTPEFQRLRNIKQLSTCHYVFPSATHTRFEHSLGVAHLARMWSSRLVINNEGEHNTRRTLDMITIGGLIHDLGHGCLSHTFDSLFMKKKRPERNWSHEEGSVLLFNKIVADNHLDLNNQDIQMVEDIVHGRVPLNSVVTWPFEIVSNSLTSIDVDKFDYFMRDSKFLGVSTLFNNPNRLIGMSSVINGRIAFEKKLSLDISNFYHTRYSLFKQAYSHRVSKAVEHMVCDALIEVDDLFGISSAVDDMERFLSIDDHLISRIQWSQGDSPRLKKAKEIIHRINTRDLYNFVAEFILPSNFFVEPQDISTHSDGQLSPDDVIISNNTLAYKSGASDQDPFENILFYDSNHEVLKLKFSDVSKLGPSCFKELCIQVFVRNKDNTDAAGVAFEKFLHQHGINSFKYKPKQILPRSSQLSSPRGRASLLSPNFLNSSSDQVVMASVSQSPLAKRARR
ncbi:hypothetical protein P9112_007563 [Eukaryota sp. TZLM1-RC]